MAKDYVLEKRKFVIGGVAVCIVLIYMMRLFFLQISTDDYKKNADSNAFLNKIQYPSRGAMYMQLLLTTTAVCWKMKRTQYRAKPNDAQKHLSPQISEKRSWIHSIYARH